MKIIGHRGARGLAPENSLDAIQAALKTGVDGVEIDVRVTLDKIPVLNHGLAIEKGLDHKAIALHDYAELKAFKPNLATLEEALNLIGTKATPMIEVKAHELVQPVVDVLQNFLGGMYSRTGMQLGSKNQATLRELHKALPEVPVVVIEPWSGVRASWRARELGTKQISMRSWWLWSGFLRAMKRRGYLLTAYTMNNPAKMQKWLPYLDGVVTDYPDRFPGNLGRPGGRVRHGDPK